MDAITRFLIKKKKEIIIINSIQKPEISPNQIVECALSIYELICYETKFFNRKKITYHCIFYHS